MNMQKNSIHRWTLCLLLLMIGASLWVGPVWAQEAPFTFTTEALPGNWKWACTTSCTKSNLLGDDSQVTILGRIQGGYYDFIDIYADAREFGSVSFQPNVKYNPVIQDALSISDATFNGYPAQHFVADANGYYYEGYRFDLGNSRAIVTVELGSGSTARQEAAEILAGLRFNGTGVVPTPTTTPTAGGCMPTVRGLSPRKPGDVISPGATYTYENGKEVGIIQERWYFNGQETTSIVWDGQEVFVELQWTCLDNIGYYRTYEIPAFQTPPVAQPGAQSMIPGLGGAGSVPGPQSVPQGVIGVVLPGVIAIGVSILGGISGGGGKPPVPPSGTGGGPEKEPPAPPVAPGPVPEPPKPQAPPVPPPKPPSPPPAQPGKIKLDPSLKKPWEQKISDLNDELTKVRQEFKDTNSILQPTKRLHKKNILKVILKGGLETFTIIVDSSTGGGGNIGKGIMDKWMQDQVTDKIFGKHDTSKDGKIVVDTQKAIDNMNKHLEDLKARAKAINKEISSIKKHIADNF